MSWELVGADAGLAFQAVSLTLNKSSGVFPVQASAFMVPARERAQATQQSYVEETEAN